MKDHSYITYNSIPDIKSKGIVQPLNVSELCSTHDEHLKQISARNKSMIPENIRSKIVNDGTLQELDLKLIESTLKSGYIDNTSSELKYSTIKKENVLDLIRDK